MYKYPVRVQLMVVVFLNPLYCHVMNNRINRLSSVGICTGSRASGAMQYVILTLLIIVVHKLCLTCFMHRSSLSMFENNFPTLKIVLNIKLQLL